MESYPQPKPCADGNGTAKPHYWRWHWTNPAKWPEYLICGTCGQRKLAEDVAKRVIG